MRVSRSRLLAQPSVSDPNSKSRRNLPLPHSSVLHSFPLPLFGLPPRSHFRIGRQRLLLHYHPWDTSDVRSFNSPLAAFQICGRVEERDVELRYRHDETGNLLCGPAV
jgi:hypothetical protein